MIFCFTDIFGCSCSQPFNSYCTYSFEFNSYSASEWILSLLLFLALLKNHLLPHSVCLSAILDTHKMKTIDGNRLQLMCNQSGVFVEDAKISSEQIVADNGVISIISRVLIPDRGTF